jgi:hypothetical protein
MYMSKIRNKNTILILQSEVTRHLADLNVDGRRYQNISEQTKRGLDLAGSS